MSRTITAVLLCYTFATVADADACPAVPEGGPLRFTKELAKEDYARSGHFRTVQCCAAGFDEISWYRRTANDVTWMPYPWSSCEPLGICLGERNMTLEFRSPSDGDEGNYKCVIRNKTETKSHDMYLHIVKCDTIGKGPYIIKRPADKDVDLGENITFTCEGYFGCGDADLRDVDWYSEDTNGFWVPMSFSYRTNLRYNVTKFTRKDDTELGANLTICDVQDQDLEVPFKCKLSTAYLKDGQKTVIVKLRKKVHINEASMAIILAIVFGVVGLIVIVFIVFAVVKKMCGPQILFYARSRMGRLPKQGELKPFRTEHRPNKNKTIFAFPEIRVDQFERSKGTCP